MPSWSESESQIRNTMGLMPGPEAMGCRAAEQGNAMTGKRRGIDQPPKGASTRDMSYRAKQGSWHAHISRLVTLTMVLCIIVPTLAAEGQTSGFCKKTGQEEPKFFCDDFSSGTAERWEPDGGVWTVEDGEYVGEGTSDTFTPCGFILNQSLIRDLAASDVDIQADMRSIERVDKYIVLRLTKPFDNQIAVNFRAERPGEFPADLIVQEVIGCEFILHTAEFEVLIPPHQVGETIHVRVKLIGNRVQVWIDNHLVLNRSFPFAATTGRMGLAVIEGGITAFDNVQVHVLK
jgi:hypothetical protein